MDKGKILSKGRIVLPQHIRDSLDVHEGNSLTIEVSEGEIILKKVKTIHHFIGTLSNFGMTIDDIREQTVKAGAKIHA